MADRYQGRISHTNKEKGWGFITSLDIPFKKIYFYWESLHSSIDFQSLKRGTKVEFNTYDHPEKGLQAVNITLQDDTILGKDLPEAKTERIK